MKKTTLFFILILVICSLFSSCVTVEKINKSATELSSTVTRAVPLQAGYYELSDAYFDYYFADDDGSSLSNRCVSDWSIVKSKSQSSENEIGILICRDGHLEEVKNICKNYLEDRRGAYLEAKAAYTPEEYEKYRDADMRVYGNCVVYLILNENDRFAAISAIESALSK